MTPDVLVFRSVTLEESGVYTCVLTSGHHRIATVSAQVRIDNEDDIQEGEHGRLSHNRAFNKCLACQRRMIVSKAVWSLIGQLNIKAKMDTTYKLAPITELPQKKIYIILCKLAWFMATYSCKQRLCFI